MSPSGSDNDSDDAGSVCSNLSNMSTLSTMSSSRRGDMKGSGSRSTGRNRTVHLSVSDCAIEIEQQGSSEPLKASLCTDFKQLCGEGSHAEGLMQCLQMYGYQTPNKLQQHSIPMILHFLGKQLGGATGSVGKGKSCIVIHGPAKTGKTSAVVLSLLAALDFSLPQPQAILISGHNKMDIDKYLRVFTLMQTVNYQAFYDGEEGEVASIEDKSPDVKAARTAHILVGHPRRMLSLISSVPSLCLDNVKVLVVDDAEELIHSSPVQAQKSQAHKSSPQDLRLIGLPSSREKRRSPAEEEAPAPAPTQSAQPTDTAPPMSPIEDVIQICNVLECRQYSQNMSDTYGIRSGQEQGVKIRNVILSETLNDPSSKKVMRLLRNSLMKKKNLLGMENCPPPTKLIKGMKHYYAAAPHTEWVRVFAGLVQSLMFPRALIFCDEENIGKFYEELQEMGISVSANLPGANGGEGVNEVRRRAMQDFTSNKTQFLLTHSEPAVCQTMLPKVSCVFHFGIPSHMPSIYGVRLLPLDAKVVKDSASILLVEPSKGLKPGAQPSVVTNLGKLFGITFMDMPWEFLPTTSTGPSKR